MKRRTMFITAALATLGLGAWTLTGDPQSPSTRPATEAEARRIGQIRSDILRLQAMGNRATFDRQWEAARWIAAQLAASGLQVTIDAYERDDASWPNVVARLSGEEDAEVLLTTHLDSMARDSADAPGADDNASGVAVMLQVARDLAATRPARRIVFASFSNEERGLGGSSSYAAAARARGDRIAAVVNIDTLGYNRPARPALLDAARPHGSLKYRIKGAWRGLRNYAIGLAEGDDVLLVAGRGPNRTLVQAVTDTLRRVQGIHVRSRVDDECG